MFTARIFFPRRFDTLLLLYIDYRYLYIYMIHHYITDNDISVITITRTAVYHTSVDY